MIEKKLCAWQEIILKRNFKYMKINSYIILSLLLFFIISCDDDNKEVGQIINFNSDWQFKIDDQSNISEVDNEASSNFVAWENVHLPHTPKIEPLIVNDQWQGTSWYKKEFQLTQQQKHQKLYLKFEAAMNIAEVWVNGEKLKTHQGGYLPFVVDFTSVANLEKPNTVVVKLNNQDNSVTGPKPLDKLDFNTYGGLYRNVWLITKNKLHITNPILEDKTASGGIFVQYSDVSEKMANVHIQTHIRNEKEQAATFFIRNKLFYKDSLIIAEDSEIVTLESKADINVTKLISVESPQLWSPAYPNLYTLKTEIIANDRIVDAEETRIGIKTIHFEGQDFYLNGKKTFLRGVNRHQEYPYVGYALSDNANYRDAKKIKEAGFDYVRISHYPHSPAFMDACDELGLMTIDAILGWQYYEEDVDFKSHVLQTARDLIRRDRNHASVLAWEVSLNESWMPEAFIDSLTTIAHQEYPGDQAFSAGWQTYGYDIYLQARQHRLDHYDESLKKPYVVSEYGDWEYYAMNAGLNQDSWGDLLQEERSSRQLRSAGEKALLQQATNIQEAHNDNLSIPAFADGYWVMFDYNRGYADDLEASGIMSIFRLPKPSYYFYKSQRNADHPFGEPMVYIASTWQKNSPLDVRVFSNADEVELFLNGESLGRQQPDSNSISNHLNHPPFTFSLERFEAGELLAKAYIADVEVATHQVMTPQQPTRLTIEVDDNYPDLKEEANDLYFVHAYITDDNGTVVPDFSGEIEFSIEEGEAEIVGENPISASAGIASILIKTSENVETIKISARSKEPQLHSTKRKNAKSTSFEKQTDSLALIPKLFLDHQLKNKAFCIVRGDQSKKQIALTFDDDPTEITDDILDIFEQQEAGSQGYYRPSFGAIKQEQIEFLASKDIKTVLWSLTTMDWDENQNIEDQLFDKFKTHLHNGAIVLLHDFDFGNPKEKLKALDRMLDFGKAHGYEFVTIANI